MNIFHEFEVISTYTRQQAIDDGVLVDVTKEANESGFKLPTSIGDNLYHHFITPSEELESEGQSIRGRLHDVFTMLHFAVRRHKEASRLTFEVLFQMKGQRQEKVTILAIVGPGDDMEPVLTICLPEDE